MLNVFKLNKALFTVLLFNFIFSVSFLYGQYTPFYFTERNITEHSFYQDYLDLIDGYNRGESYSDIINEMDTLAINCLNQSDGIQFLFFNNEIANLYRQQGKFFEAYDVLESSMENFKIEYDTIHMEYLVSIRLFRTTLNSLLHRPEGFDHSGESINELFQAQFDLLEALNNEGEPLRNTLIDYGLHLLRQGKTEKAIQTFYEARSMALEANDLATLAVADYSIMNNINISYDLKKTQTEVLKNDIELFELNQASIPVLLYSTFIQSKVSYNYFHDFNNTEQAIYYAEKAAALLDTLRYPSHNIRASIHGNLALYYSDIDDSEKVWQHAHITRGIIESQPMSHYNRALPYVLLADAAIPFSTDSVFTYLSVLDTLEGKQFFEDKIIEVRAKAHMENGDYAKVAELVLTVFDNYDIVGNAKVPKISSSVDYINQFYFLNLLQQAYKKKESVYQHEYTTAIVALIELQNKLFREIVTEDIFGFEPTGLAQIYNEFLENALPYMFAPERKDFVNEKFKLAFASKSLHLNNLMAKKKFQSLLESETDLFNKLLNSSLEVQKSRNRLASSSQSDPDDVYLKKMDLNSKLIDYFMLRHEVNDIHRSRIKKQFNNNIKIASLKDIQSQLENDEALLEFFVMDNSWGQILVLPDTTVSFYYKDEELMPKIESERYNLLTGRETTDLGDVLFKNIFTLLENTSKLVIIPDKNLNHTPVETMKVNNKMLIKNFSVSYAYSATLWYNLRRERSKTSPENMLTIAPTFVDPLEQDQIILSASYRGNESLKALPFSLKEIKGIDSIMQNTINDIQHLYAENATFYNVKKNIKDFDIVHFATHGIVNPQYPERSGLYLYREVIKDTDQTETGFLSLGELYNLDLDTELVVLSSCNTGRGKLVEGEGVVALPRGFILSGVPKVVATLWKVHDERTKDIMLLFYEYIAKDYEYHEALRHAKLDAIDKGYLPMDWAAFIMIGS